MEKLLGKFEKTIKKKKLHIPKIFLRICGNRFRIYATAEKYLILVPEGISMENLKNNENFLKAIFLGTLNVSSRGYIRLTEEMLNACGLDDSEVVIVGMIDWMEVWRKDVFVNEYHTMIRYFLI